MGLLGLPVITVSNVNVLMIRYVLRPKGHFLWITRFFGITFCWCGVGNSLIGGFECYRYGICSLELPLSVTMTQL